MSFNLQAASTQFCCSFWCFAHTAISAAEKAIDLSALFLEMLNSFSQYLEHDNDESESDHERLSEEDSDHQESEDNWDSEDENCQEVEDSSEVEGNRESSTFDEMRARLRRRSRETARSKGAARSVVFGCSVRVVDFLRLSDALEGVRESSRGRFWLRRWGIWNKNGYKNVRNINKQRGLNSFNFGQLGGDEVDFWIPPINGSSWGRAKMNAKDSKPFCIR